MAATENAIESIDLDHVDLEADALRRVPRELALRHDILSISSEGNQLTVALADPDDRDAIERIRLVTGMHVRAMFAPRDAIRTRLSNAYGATTPRDRADAAPAIRALDEILADAIRAGASDVHVEPAPRGGRVRVRVDGVLFESRMFPADLHGQIVSRIKVLAGMDIADRRQPQDGGYVIERPEGPVDARVSSMPTILGEKLVVRLLDRHANVRGFVQLGIPARFHGSFVRAVQAPHGLVVVCGPTGSGKTTTLYAAMAERNRDSQNVCSVEDPVEVRIPGVAQVQVNPRAGITFASALRAFLRQDPNVIMVGEMRDEETAAVAASAALCGQLVVTTMHANDAPKTIDRLVELGVSRDTIAAGLTAVIAQRLVRRLCDRCRGCGCRHCRTTGYAGRIAIFECLFVDDCMRRSIAEGASSAAIAQYARTRGYEPMGADGMRRVAAGETTLEELRRVLPVEESS